MNLRYSKFDIKKIKLSKNFYNPFGSKKNIRSLKDLSYYDAFKLFNLNPLGDADKDKVPNWRDCKPFDPKRHGDLPPQIPQTPVRYATELQPGVISTDIEPQETPQTASWSVEVDSQPQPVEENVEKKPRKKRLFSRSRKQSKTKQWDGVWRLYYRQANGKWDFYGESVDKTQIFNTASELKSQPYIAEIWIDKRTPDVMLKLLNRRLTRERVVGKVKDVAQRAEQGITNIDYESLAELRSSAERYSRGPFIPPSMRVRQRPSSVLVKTPVVSQRGQRPYSHIYTPPWLRNFRARNEQQPRLIHRNNQYFLLVPIKKNNYEIKE